MCNEEVLARRYDGQVMMLRIGRTVLQVIESESTLFSDRGIYYVVRVHEGATSYKLMGKHATPAAALLAGRQAVRQ